MKASSVAGAVMTPLSLIHIAVLVGLDAAGNAEPAVHVDPFVLEAGKPALDLLEIGEVVDLAEVRELLLGAHAQRVDLVDGAAEHAVIVDHGRAVPSDVGLVHRHRLEHLDVVAEQREVRKDVDVDGFGGGEVEDLLRPRAEASAQFLLIVLGAGRRSLDRPQASGAFLDVRPLVLEVVAVAHIGHVHRLVVGRALVIGHALVGHVGLPVLHLEQRAMGEHDVVAVARIIVGELPVALVFQPVRLAHLDLAVGLAVEPLVDRLGDGAEIIEERWRIGVERAEDEAAIAVDPRHLRDVELRVLEVAGIAVGPRHRAQLAAVEIAPAVIGAGEDACVALFLAAERGAAVGAAVEQRPDLAVAVAQEDDRAQPETHGDVVVVLGDLALVAKIDPDRAEDVGHLRLEDRRVGVDQAMDAIVLHQLVPVVEVRALDPGAAEFVQHGYVSLCS